MTIDEAIQRYEEAVQWEQYSMRSENINKAAVHRQLAEWLKELKRLRAQEPCDDAVSREAIESILYELYEVCTNMDELVHCMDDNLKKLPSVTPQRTGKWKMISPAGVYECSKCGQNVLTKDIDCYKFCHGCGAKMNGGNQNE